MRDFKILIVVVIFCAVLYIGIKPFAESKMETDIVPPDFNFTELPAVAEGNVAKGKQIVSTTCIACHSVSSQGMKSLINKDATLQSLNVIPPDLSNVGYLLDDKFLAAFIEDPVKATHLETHFSGSKPYPMPAYISLTKTPKQDIADIVSYFKSIAPKSLTAKASFESVCATCHSLKYADINSTTPDSYLLKYIGVVPPDLSLVYISKGEEFINGFLNKPQDNLENTAMPRVGLNSKAQAEIISYLEDVADPKKEERERVIGYIIVFFLIFTIFAYLWKVSKWRDHH